MMQFLRYGVSPKFLLTKISIISSLAIISRLPSPHLRLSNLMSSLTSLDLEKKNKKKLIYDLVYSVLWSIWKPMNSVIFKKKMCSPMKTVDDIQLLSYNWFKHRARFKGLNWNLWCCSHIMACNLLFVFVYTTLLVLINLSFKKIYPQFVKY